MTTVQVVAVPLQAPLQPVKVLPLVDAAVRVTLAPESIDALQVPAVHEMPPVLEVTVPVPVPASVTDRVYDVVVGMAVKVALVVAAADIVTEQEVDVPAQEPVQPANWYPVVGVAVSVTEVPVVKDAEHAEPQLMPVGELATLPLPARETASVWLVVRVDRARNSEAEIMAAVEPVAVSAPPTDDRSELPPPPPQAVKVIANANDMVRTRL